MKRRYFLALGALTLSSTNRLFAKDYRKSHLRAWEASSLNDAAMALYGREKFLTLQKSKDITLHVPKAIVKNREEIPIGIDSTIVAKTVSIFQDANEKSLVAVFHLNEQSIISYEITIRMDFKGTLFAVVEGIDGHLYYTRQYIDILTMVCMSSGV